LLYILLLAVLGGVSDLVFHVHLTLDPRLTLLDGDRCEFDVLELFEMHALVELNRLRQGRKGDEVDHLILLGHFDGFFDHALAIAVSALVRADSNLADGQITSAAIDLVDRETEELSGGRRQHSKLELLPLRDHFQTIVVECIFGAFLNLGDPLFPLRVGFQFRTTGRNISGPYRILPSARRRGALDARGLGALRRGAGWRSNGGLERGGARLEAERAHVDLLMTDAAHHRFTYSRHLSFVRKLYFLVSSNVFITYELSNQIFYITASKIKIINFYLTIQKGVLSSKLVFSKVIR